MINDSCMYIYNMGKLASNLDIMSKLSNPCLVIYLKVVSIVSFSIQVFDFVVLTPGGN